MASPFIRKFRHGALFARPDLNHTYTLVLSPKRLLGGKPLMSWRGLQMEVSGKMILSAESQPVPGAVLGVVQGFPRNMKLGQSTVRALPLQCGHFSSIQFRRNVILQSVLGSVRHPQNPEDAETDVCALQVRVRVSRSWV